VLAPAQASWWCLGKCLRTTIESIPAVRFISRACHSLTARAASLASAPFQALPCVHVCVSAQAHTNTSSRHMHHATAPAPIPSSQPPARPWDAHMTTSTRATTTEPNCPYTSNAPGPNAAAVQLLMPLHCACCSRHPLAAGMMPPRQWTCAAGRRWLCRQ